MKNVLVLINHNAGRKRAIKYKKSLINFLFKKNIKFKFIEIDELNKIDTTCFDTIIVMGGDGTINKVLPYLKNKTLGIVPVGTANLLAHKLGISNFKKAIKTLDMENIKTIDLLKINEKLSILRFGIGYDAKIISKTPQTMKNKFGYLAYFIAGLFFLLKLKKREYILIKNNKEENINASCIICANSANMYKNLISIGNSSLLDDKLFEVCIFKTQNPILFIFELIKIIFNIKKSNSIVQYFKTDNLKIISNYISSHIDGEENKFINSEVSVKILHNEISVFKY